MARLAVALIAVAAPLSLGKCYGSSQDEVSLLQIRSHERDGLKGRFAAMAGSKANATLQEAMGHCYDGRDLALRPDMLHVAWVCDVSQLVGVEASLTSLIMHSKDPSKLFVHVMVQKQWEQDFKKSLGIPADCEGVQSVHGAFLRVNPFNPKMVHKSMADLSAHTLAKGSFRGLDSVENYARFYMHRMMPPVVVVYLDADTIVQSDLGYLKNKLLYHQKTVGFIERVEPEQIGHVLHSPTDCEWNFNADMAALVTRPTYNVGVYVVDLKRWAERNITDRVESLVAMQNACQGNLWDGGSQPPLLLAFEAHSEDEEPDYMSFPASWNYARLGYVLGMDYADLAKKSVLHWNGAHKAWLEDGYYKDIWTPYAEIAPKVIRGEQPIDNAGLQREEAEANEIRFGTGAPEAAE